jgi:hypothetical protein
VFQIRPTLRQSALAQTRTDHKNTHDLLGGSPNQRKVQVSVTGYAVHKGEEKFSSTHLKLGISWRLMVNPLTPNDLQKRRAVSPLKIKIPSKNMREKQTNATINHSVY